MSVPNKGPPLPPGRPNKMKVVRRNSWADYAPDEDDRTDGASSTAVPPPLPDSNSDGAMFRRNDINEDDQEKTSRKDNVADDISPPPPPPQPLPPRPTAPPRVPVSHQPETSPTNRMASAAAATEEGAQEEQGCLTFDTCNMPPSLLAYWDIKEGSQWYELLRANELVLTDGTNVPGVEENWVYCLLCSKKFYDFKGAKLHVNSSHHQRRIEAFRGDTWSKPSPRTPADRRSSSKADVEGVSYDMPEYVNDVPQGLVCTVCSGTNPAAVMPSSDLVYMHLSSDQHNSVCIRLGIEPFRDFYEDSATLVGERDAEIMSENRMVTIRYQDSPLWVYCAACDARMEGITPLHRHVDSIEHRDAMVAENSPDRRNGWSWSTTPIIDDEGMVVGRRRSSATTTKVKDCNNNNREYERDEKWPSCIEDSDYGWECAWCDAQLATPWHVNNHLAGKKHKKAIAYREYEDDDIPPPPPQEPVLPSPPDSPISKLKVKKPLRPLKPAMPPRPRRPSRSPRRTDLEGAVMDFQGRGTSPAYRPPPPPPPPPPQPIEVTSPAHSSVDPRYIMSRESFEPVTFNAGYASRSHRHDARDDYRRGATYQSPDNRSHHRMPPEIYNERPSPNNAYYDTYRYEGSHHTRDYDPGYDMEVHSSDSRDRRRDRYGEAYTPLEPWGSSGYYEHESSRKAGHNRFHFVTGQCIKVYGAFPPKFITKDCVCEACMVGPGRDLPLDSHEGMSWAAEHVYLHLKTRITSLDMGTCFPVRK